MRDSIAALAQHLKSATRLVAFRQPPDIARLEQLPGVRSVQSVTIGGIGDVGLFALVLVKPLATFALRGIDAATEVDYLTDFSALPEIVDDAYLNFIALPSGTLSGAPIHGLIETLWSAP